MKIFYKIFLGGVLSSIFCIRAISQQNFTKLLGGLEGTSGTMINNAIGRSTTWWSISNATTQLSEETGIVRSGSRSLKITTSSATPRRAHLPSMPSAAPSKVVVQYYRRVTTLANSVKDSVQVSPDGGMANLQNSLSASLPSAPNAWEKVVFVTTVQVTPSTAWAAIVHQAVGTGGSLYIDDASIYTADGDFEDNTAPSPIAGSITVTKGTSAPSLTPSWAVQNFDGGGYLLVRYTQDPLVVSAAEPNPNGIYSTNSIISGANPGLIMYSGTSISYLDEAVEPGTQYWYRVYVYDKAYNYSAPVQTGPVQSIGDTYYAADMDPSHPWYVNDYTTWRNKQGQLPPPFTTDPYPVATYFKILRDAEINGTWKIKSTLPNYSTSKVFVGDGANPVTLTIQSTGTISTDKSDLVEVNNNATVIIKCANTPSAFQSTPNPAATIIYGGDNQAIGTFPHPNVIFKGTGIKSATSFTVNGDCKILENSMLIVSGTITLNKNFEIVQTASFDAGNGTGPSAFFKSTNVNHVVTSNAPVRFNNVVIRDNGTLMLNADTRISRALTIYPTSVVAIGSTKTLRLDSIQGVITPIPNPNPSLAGSKTSNLVLGSKYKGALYFAQSLLFPEGNYLNSLVDSATNDLALQTTLNIVPSDPFVPNTGFIEIKAGRLVINPSGKLNLLSDSKGSARIARASSTNNPYLVGNITANRFIPGKRAWRMLTAPVTPVAAVDKTINAVWQKGYVSNGAISYKYSDYQKGDIIPVPAPPAGVGTHITGGTGANFYNKTDDALSLGYDVGVTAAGATASIRLFDPTKNKWVSFADAGLENEGPGTIGINDYPAYLLFVRGDRDVHLWEGTSAQDKDTQLETIGVAGQGDKNNVILTYTKEYPYAIVGNPYPSPIDAEAVLATNSAVLKDYCYVWDSRLNNYGGYKLIYNGADLPLDIGGPTILPASKHIQSAQGFLAVLKNSSILNQTIKINEAHKSDNTSTAEFGKRGTPLVYISLYKTIANTPTLTDGVLARFGETYSYGFGDDDIPKPNNLYETLSIMRGGKSLIMESKPTVTNADTVFLQLTGTGVQAYQFKVLGSDFRNQSVSAFLVDSYLKKETPISLDSTINTINFSITSAAASKSIDRFKIIFRANTVLPLNFTSVKAYLKESDIAVDWTVAQEINVDHYEVERSGDGTQFLKAGSVRAIGNNPASYTYNWLDNAPLDGYNYYRIRSVDKTGESKLSSVVRVKMNKAGESGFSVYPNPVTDKRITVELNNTSQGNYQVSLYNSAGQQVFAQPIVHQGGSASKVIALPGNLAKGVYQVKLAGSNFKVIKVTVQ